MDYSIITASCISNCYALMKMSIAHEYLYTYMHIKILVRF